MPTGGTAVLRGPRPSKLENVPLEILGPRPSGCGIDKGTPRSSTAPARRTTIEGRVSQIQGADRETPGNYDREKLQERLAKPRRRRRGDPRRAGRPEVGVKERKDRVDDALERHPPRPVEGRHRPRRRHASARAKVAGVRPATSDNPDIRAGIKILPARARRRRSVRSPRTPASRARSSSAGSRTTRPETYGFNAQDEELRRHAAGRHPSTPPRSCATLSRTPLPWPAC